MTAYYMICIYFIGGSHFTRNIKNSVRWVSHFKNNGYFIKPAMVADIGILVDDCYRFIDTCRYKYSNPTIGVIGVSSGGYFAMRLKKIIPRLDFCIGVAPILNPVLRSKMVDSGKIIRSTPKVRKIYNTIDNDTLIIVARDDIDAPLVMYNDYDISNLVILNHVDHSITDGTYTTVYKKIESFLK
jgi:hypothetical protein